MAAAYWIAGDLPAAAVPPAMPDPVLGLTFLWWLRMARPMPHVPVVAPVVRSLFFEEFEDVPQHQDARQL
jgi:hypothetical protein